HQEVITIQLPQAPTGPFDGGSPGRSPPTPDLSRRDEDLLMFFLFRWNDVTCMYCKTFPLRMSSVSSVTHRISDRHHNEIIKSGFYITNTSHHHLSLPRPLTM